MSCARLLVVATLAAALSACGGSNNEGSAAVDSVTLTVAGGTPATFRDDAANVSILAAAGTSSNTLVTLDVTSTTPGGNVNFHLSLPAGQTGTAVSGEVTMLVIGGYSCSGAVTVNVTSSATSRGGQVAGSFGPTNLCGGGSIPVAASFSATHL